MQQRLASSSSAGASRVGVRLRRRQTTAIAAAAADGPSSSPPPRAVVIFPGLGNDASDYAPLAELLRRSGAAHVSVAPVERWNWGLNVLALKDPRWWRGELPPRPAVDWFLRRADAAVQEAASAVASDGGRVTILAHSAGGWIGRVYLRDYRRRIGGAAGGGGAEGGVDEASAAAAAAIDRFVSLGSPHRAPPLGVEGVVDQTRGILTWVEQNCPGAHLHDEGVRYVTVGGRLVRGRALDDKANEGGDKGEGQGQGQGEKGEAGNGKLLARAAALFAGVGYQQVCGRADAHGDFIVPVDAAHLGDPRAAEVDIEGVFHSPLGEGLRVLPPWYGHESVFGAWARYVVGGEDELPEPGRRHRVSAAAWRGQGEEDAQAAVEGGAVPAASTLSS